GGAHNASGFAHVPKHHVTDHAAIHHRARQHPDSQYSPLDLPADESHGQHHQSKPDHLEHSVGRHVLLMEKSHVVSLVRPHRAYDDFHGSIAVSRQHLTTVHILQHNHPAKSRRWIANVPALLFLSWPSVKKPEGQFPEKSGAPYADGAVQFESHS